MTTTHYMTDLLLRLFALLPLYAFLVGCFFLWRQTYMISLGHKYFGKLAMIILFVYDVLCTRYPDYGVMFRPFANGAMTLWVVYNGYYFYRFPIPWKYLQAGSGVVARDEEYVPHFKVEKILVSAPRKSSFFFTTSFKWIAVFIFFCLLSSWFIGEIAQLLVESDKRVMQAQQETRQKVQQTARSVSSEIKQAVAVAVDTLKAGQATASDRVDGRMSELSGRVEASTHRKLRTRKAPDRPLIIIAPAPKTALPQSNFTLPDEVAPPAAPRKGRKYGHVGEYKVGQEIAEVP